MTTLPAGGGGPALNLQGLFGTAEQLRVDRCAYANWERAARELETQEGAAIRTRVMIISS